MWEAKEIKYYRLDDENAVARATAFLCLWGVWRVCRECGLGVWGKKASEKAQKKRQEGGKISVLGYVKFL